MVRVGVFNGFFGGFERCGSLRLRSVQAAAFSGFVGGFPRRRRRRERQALQNLSGFAAIFDNFKFFAGISPLRASLGLVANSFSFLLIYTQKII